MGILVTPFVAPGIGRIHRRDLTGDLLAEESIEVVVVGSWGQCINARLAVVELWQSGGWSRCLGCPGCGRAVRVLRVAGEGLLCGACAPRRSVAARLSLGKWKSTAAMRERAERMLMSAVASGTGSSSAGVLVEDYADRVQRAREGALAVVEEVMLEFQAGETSREASRANPELDRCDP